jgi:hypothetical protein
MQKLSRRTLMLMVQVVVFLGLAAKPAAANFITSANVNLTCTSYTINVTGGNLDTPNVSFSVSYTINVVMNGSSTFTISDSIPVTPDASLNFNASVTKAVGPLSGSFSLTGTATLVDSAGKTYNTVDISFSPNPLVCQSSPPPPCETPSANSSNFNGTPMSGGNFIWFNANFNASGIPSSGAVITFTNSTIQLGDTGQTLAVPNAQITFSPSASCASTTFDSITNTWMTTVPIGGSDEIFLDGLAYQLAAGFSGTIHGSVVWNGNFSRNVPGVTVQWKWGAAVYTNFTTDYNALNVKASHQNACGMNNSDHAGTPEGTDTSTGRPFKGFVIGGARGGGGSNFTGSWSGTQSVKVCS